MRYGEKIRRPGVATAAVIGDALAGGDFYQDEAIAAFAWSMLLQAGGLAEFTG